MSLPRPIHALTAAAAAVAVALGPTALPASAVPAQDLPSAGRLTSAVPAQDLPSADQLTSALLTAADLGPGHTEIPVTQSPSTGEGPIPVTGCAALSALINMHAAQTGTDVQRAAVALDGPGGNPVVTQVLAAEVPDRLAADFDTAVDALRTCHSITFNAGPEDTVTFTVTPVTLGDRKEAPAVHLDGTLAGVRLSAYIGIERFGNVAMAFGFFERQGASEQTASEQYRTAVAKIERILGAKAGSTTAPTAAGPGVSV
ncbi:hypothetical protein [Streptomyces sp. LS1784]|uniref:hypothetical protein n=1 Tax=Streptomyces sp. LS1784 TaxID=2851533 RepID=UPI001CCE3F5B|nr:hypothetical protein [Streptomyces sp. LS1784]